MATSDADFDDESDAPSVLGDEQVSTLPVRKLVHKVRLLGLEVVEGPDKGKTASSESSLSVGTADGNDVVLTDPTVSRFHLVLRRRAGRIVLRDLGSTNGTRVGSVLLRGAEAEVGSSSILEIGKSQLRLLAGPVVALESGTSDFGGVLGTSEVMRQVFASLARIAPTDVAVLLLGESGTGKEMVARSIHDASERRKGPFEIVDCGALPPSLFASELFGHERGAFTGADRRHVGAFERAAGGTLFLDEVGELSAEVQSALLGVLERRTMRPLGSTRQVPVDVRLVSATSRDLRKEVNSGGFRLDLYYRLAVVLLELPPLRERRDDIRMLAQRFIAESGSQATIEEIFPPAEMARLMGHEWRGNVRELRNVVLGTLALGHSALGRGSAPDAKGSAAGFPSYRDARRTALDAFEKQYITDLLAHTDGNVRAAAREAKMDRNYLTELLRRHHVK
jgi:DNA-binding NtrC family response regulator